ncbi:MAG: hypothetical protein A2452_11050 [Candidatus Firestonebacteria bacterium RIFOXYC2_FULL_39_67]|nr:MAG: hypothetical protein A2452_11050 [Candidatus Firestonebacteria bacterium RIFOXYC2_FULL_39_67]
MQDQYVDIEKISKNIAPNLLKIPKAKEIYFTLQSELLNYVKFIECRSLNEWEIIVFDVEVELCQKTTYDIRRYERIAAIFHITDKSYPEVWALRKDFPKVPHLMLNDKEYPRRLCLYDKSYDELKLDWTATRFIERIREWLAYTAKGILHGKDQPLEPLFFGNLDQLIIPTDYFSKNEYRKINFIDIYKVGEEKPSTLIIHSGLGNKDSGFASISFRCDSIRHGIVNKTPITLLELHEFTSKANLDLLTELRNILKVYCSEKDYKKILDSFLIIIVAFPKIREDGLDIEVTDIWSFFCKVKIRDIGKDIGIWDISNGKAVYLIKQENGIGENIGLSLLKTMFSFSKIMASEQNGLFNQHKVKLTLIGLGALGSQIFMNLIRAGWGQWNLIDNDIFLPHNLARHILDIQAIGLNKAFCLSCVANNMMDDGPMAKAIPKDVLSTGDKEIQEALKETDVIIDCSTSIAVARFLARDVDSSSRRISMFLSPNGEDCVVLAEDKNREIYLDQLEMQYYRFIINNEKMKGHLKNNESINRYGNSCRDINSSISQELIALHASVCSNALRNIVLSEDASISVWRIDTKDFTVSKHYASPLNMIEIKIKDWVLYLDEWLVNKISNARLQKLPNETGGILVGSFDMKRKIVYIVDTLLSPEDSIEWPTVYIRGCQGLQEKMKEISDNTLERLEYVGEWHSHPAGCSCKPSETDYKAFEMLSNSMRLDGLPTIMLIFGDNNEYGIYLGKMEFYKK